MAQAPGDPDETDLEQRILQVLRDAGSPVKSVQLAKECQVPKKNLNQVLYRMLKESKVSLEGPATWGLGQGGTREVEPAEPAQPSQEEDIYRILENHGPCKALTISQKLGKKTAKEVNPDLYAMRRKHLLDLDEKSSTWAIYRPDLAGRNPAPAIIYQKNPINMICQNGPNNHISIGNSESIQIGHGNVIVRPTASGENGESSERHLLPVGRGPCSIWVGAKMGTFKRTGRGELESQAGGRQGSGPPSSCSWGPPDVSVFALFEIRMPKPGPSAEEEVAQRVRIRSCFLEDTAIGNSNRMTVSSETAGPEGVVRPEDSKRDPGETGKDAGEPGTQWAPQFPHNRDQDPPGNSDVLTFISHLEAVTLESGDPQTIEDSSQVDRTPDMDSRGQVETGTNRQALSGRAGRH
uniref:Z-DNA-binding protein 1 n=1 Tax=Neovison vison TaxID=452646 RepID=A0A8C7BZS5_NEOVI